MWLFIQFCANWLGCDRVAYLAQCTACCLFVCSYIYPNQTNMHFLQTFFSKGLIGTIACYIFARKNGDSMDFHSGNIFYKINMINILLSFYLLVFNYAQFYLPLPILHTINCVSIAIVAFMDYLINKTPISKHGKIGIFLAILGVIITTNSLFIMKLIFPDYQFQSKFDNYHSFSWSSWIWVGLLVLIGRILYSYAIVRSKQIKIISSFSFAFHNCIYAIIIPGLLYPYIYTYSSLSTVLYSLIFTGIPQFVCLYLFYFSVTFSDKTGMVMILNSSSILFAFIISIWRYNEEINIICLIGVILIITSMTLVIFGK